MKVLVVVNELELGGAERLVVDHVRHDSAETSFTVCQLSGGSRLAAELPGQPGSLVDLGSRSRLDPRVLLRLLRLTMRVRPDVLHAHLPRSGTLTAIVGRWLGIPVLYTEHNVWGAYRLTSRVLAASATHLSSRVVCVSEHVRASTLRHTGAPPAKVVTILNGIELARLPRRLTEARDGCLLLCTIANLYERKGYPFLIEALRSVRANGTMATLDIYGGGPELGRLTRLVRESGLDAAILFQGAQPNAAALLGRYDGFVLSSLAEGLPIALLEAMGVGLAVVATAVGGIPEVVCDGVNGLLVPSRDAAAIAHAITRFAQDPELRTRLGNAARETVEARLTIEATAAAYRDCYAQLDRARRH